MTFKLVSTGLAAAALVSAIGFAYAQSSSDEAVPETSAVMPAPESTGTPAALDQGTEPAPQQSAPPTPSTQPAETSQSTATGSSATTGSAGSGMNSSYDQDSSMPASERAPRADRN